MNSLCRKWKIVAAVISVSVLSVPIQAQQPETNKESLQAQPAAAFKAYYQHQASANETARDYALTLVDSAKGAIVLPNQREELLGAKLQPVTDSLRAQLDITPGLGLVVSMVKANGPSAEAGLKQNDILLLLADKPLKTVDDLFRELRAAGDSTVPLKILRSGKMAILQIRPKYSVTLGSAAEQKQEYYLGVTTASVDDALRSQLGLPEGQGLMISNVTSGTPAEKAGIKKYDIIRSVNGKAIVKPMMLSSPVQEAKGAIVTLDVMRAGKPLTIQITPAVRRVDTASQTSNTVDLLLLQGQPSFESRIINLDTTLGRLSHGGLAVDPTPSSAADVRQRLVQVEKELKTIRGLIERIDASVQKLKVGVAPPTPPMAP